jgi:hypothetical protein
MYSFAMAIQWTFKHKYWVVGMLFLSLIVFHQVHKQMVKNSDAEVAAFRAEWNKN